MKLALISFVVAGAGGLVVHANEHADAPIETRAPEALNIETLKIQREVETFIISPHKQCVVSDDDKILSNTIGECLNIERKWIKAI